MSAPMLKKMKNIDEYAVEICEKIRSNTKAGETYPYEIDEDYYIAIVTDTINTFIHRSKFSEMTGREAKILLNTIIQRIDSLDRKILKRMHVENIYCTAINCRGALRKMIPDYVTLEQCTSIGTECFTRFLNEYEWRADEFFKRRQQD